ncbi:homeodomain-like protein [Tanacetum coccineum]
MAEYSQTWHNGTSTRKRSTETSDGLADIQAQLNNLGREIKKVNEKVYAAQVGCDLCKGPHYTKDCPNKEDGKTLEVAYYTQFALADLGASISVKPLSTYLNLGLDELAHTKLTVELVDRTVKHPKGIAENILLRIRKFFSLNRVDDLEPTIKEGEVIDEPMEDLVETRNENDVINRLEDNLSLCDFDRKIHINCAYNLQFSYMIGYEHVNDNFFPLLSINVMSKKFYNSIMKDKLEYKGKNLVGAFMNVPIFLGTFSALAYFAVVENMDAYRDERVGDIIVGRPFCREVHVKARRFDMIITIYKGDESMTYQMA